MFDATRHVLCPRCGSPHVRARKPRLLDALATWITNALLLAAYDCGQNAGFCLLYELDPQPANLGLKQTLPVVFECLDCGHCWDSERTGSTEPSGLEGMPEPSSPASGPIYGRPGPY
jgi:hypothetical protein